jgi:hypothetical protein
MLGLFHRCTGDYYDSEDLGVSPCSLLCSHNLVNRSITEKLHNPT